MTLVKLLFWFSCAHAGPITIQLDADPGSLNPVKIDSLLAFGIASNLVETLMRNDVSGHLTKGLAESYEISKYGRRYRFKIRGGARWSDGKPVTLDDCVFGLINALDPKSASDDGELLFQIKNARAYFNGKVPLSAVGVRAANGHLLIELERPDSNFLNALTMPLAAPRRREFGGKYSDDQPTTGRYFIKHLMPEREIALEPNPYNKIDGQLPIKFMILSEETAAQNLFQAGKLDILSTVATDDLEKYGDRLVRKRAAYVRFLSFNTRLPPLDQLLWRKAIAASIDREAIAHVLHNSVLPTTSYVPVGLDGAKEFGALEFSKEQKLVREMKNKPRLKLGFPTGGQTEFVVERIQNDLRKKLGVEVELAGMEQKMYFASLESNTPPLYYLGQGAPFNDPINHLREFTTNPVTKDNPAHYKNAEYENLVKKIREAPPGAERTDSIVRAQELLVKKDVVVIPLLQRELLFAVSPKIKNFAISPFNVIQLAELRREP